MAREELRVAGLRLKLEGGAQLEQEMKLVRAQLRLGASEVKLFREQMRTSGPSIDGYKGQIKSLTDQVDAQRRYLEQLNDVEKQLIDQYGEDSREVALLRAEYNKTETQIERLNRQINNSIIELEKQKNEIYKAGVKWEEAGGKIARYGEKLSDVGGKMSRNITAPILAGAGYSVKAAMDFESALAGVAKTTDMTGEELEKMGRAIRDMSKELPTSATDIAAVAEAAGQLGIEKDNLLSFTRVVIDLGNATNIVGDEGAVQMAKFANIMQMSQKDFDRFGSAIVELGNNSATTERDILNMSMRLAAAGKQAGMSEADVLGISTALSSLGLEAEAGGTAFSKMITRLQVSVETGSEDLGEFARIAGMTADEFSEAWEKDAASALAAFVVGLGDFDRHGQTTSVLLEELGLKEVRLTDALRRASGANELFTDSLKMANSAWEDNTALAKEASMRYETSESKLKIQMNTMRDTAITIGYKLMPHVVKLVEGIGGLVDKFNELSPGMQNAIITGLALVAGAGPIVKVAGTLTQGIGNVTSALGKLAKALGNKQAVKAATDSLGGLSGSLGGVGTAATGAKGLLGGLATWMGSPAGLVVMSGVAAAGVLYLADQLWGLDPAVKEAQKRAEKLADEYERSNREIDTNIGVIKLYADELANLAPKEQKTAEDKEKIKFLVEDLNDLMPDLNLAYDEQADKLNISTEEIDKYIESLEKQLRMEAGRKYLKEIYEEQIRLQLELKNKRDEVTEADRRWYEAIMQHAPGSRARNNLMEDYVKIMGLWSEKSAPYVSLNEAMATAERKLVYEVSRNNEAVAGLNDQIAKHGETASNIIGIIEKEWRKGGYGAGSALSQGARAGMRDSANQLYYEARVIANRTVGEMRSTALIRSPSGKTEYMGKMLIKGLRVGMNDELDDLLRTARSIPERTLAAMNQAQHEQLQRAVLNYSSPEVVQRLSVQIQAERPIQRTINIERMEVRSDADIEKVAAALHELDRRDMRGLGVA